MTNDHDDRNDDHDRGGDDALVGAIMTLNGMAASFDTLVETVLVELRSMLSVPPETVDDVVESEFRVVEQRFQRFRPLYDRHCADLLAKHIPAAHLPAVAAALGSQAMRVYFPAMRVVREEMARISHALAAAMKDVALFEKPDGPAAGSGAAGEPLRPTGGPSPLG